MSHHLPIIFTTSLFAVVVLTWLMLRYKDKYFSFLKDIPNERSNHKTPVLRGGGVITSTIIISGIILISLTKTHDLHLIWPLILGSVALLIVSFIDDIKNLSVAVRVPVQIIAVIFGIVVLLNSGINESLLFHFLPEWLNLLIIALIWLWFINLYNFMDGIDGITCTETTFIAYGICWVIIIAGLESDFMFYLSIIIASSIGFLLWNWHPAKIFLGDSGSILLGYLLGFFLLYLACQGYWESSLIFPAYYIADSGITITKRLIAGEKIWQAHSKHFYQQAVRQGGKSHSEVVKIIAILNIILLGLGCLSVIFIDYSLPILIFSYSLVAFFLHLLQKAGNEKPTNKAEIKT